MTAFPCTTGPCTSAIQISASDLSRYLSLSLLPLRRLPGRFRYKYLIQYTREYMGHLFAIPDPGPGSWSRTWFCSLVDLSIGLRSAGGSECMMMMMMMIDYLDDCCCYLWTWP